MKRQTLVLITLVVLAGLMSVPALAGRPYLEGAGPTPSAETTMDRAGYHNLQMEFKKSLERVQVAAKTYVRTVVTVVKAIVTAIQGIVAVLARIVVQLVIRLVIVVGQWLLGVLLGT